MTTSNKLPLDFREEVEKLKAEWVRDGGEWDLVGHVEVHSDRYGPYIKELREFASTTHAQWMREEESRRAQKVMAEQERAIARAGELGFYLGDSYAHNFALAATLLLGRLESIDKRIERVADILENRGAL